MCHPSNCNFLFLFLWCLLWRKTARRKCAVCCAAEARHDGGLMILASCTSLAALAFAPPFPPSSATPAESNITPVVCQVLKQQATASGNYLASKVFFPCFFHVLQISNKNKLDTSHTQSLIPVEVQINSSLQTIRCNYWEYLMCSALNKYSPHLERFHIYVALQPGSNLGLNRHISVHSMAHNWIIEVWGKEMSRICKKIKTKVVIA